jgi:hypothetical protein
MAARRWTQMLAAEAVKPLAEQGDLTSALIRYQQKIQELQCGGQPENLSRYRRRR